VLLEICTIRNVSNRLTGAEIRKLRRSRRRQQLQEKATKLVHRHIVINRRANMKRKRLDWHLHKKTIGPVKFQRMYRLDEETFEWLCDLIREDIAGNQVRAAASNHYSGPVSAEI
jgi:hypothetical protein